MVGRRAAAVVAAVLVALGAGGSSCRHDDRAGSATPPPAGAGGQTGSPTASPTPRRATEPGRLTGVPMPSPTRLRLLTQGRLLDVDSGTTARSPYSRWLPVPGGRPLLVADAPATREPAGGVYGPARVSLMAPGPGGLRAIRLTAPALVTAAAARDGGVWLGEYADRTHCTLREVGPDGSERRPARPVPCSTNPIGETAAGLWVGMGPDANVNGTVGSGLEAWTALLLDPATFAERARYPWVTPVDEYRVVTFTTVAREEIEVRDLRTNAVTPVPLPPAYGWPSPRVETVSPDGRWLPFTFGQPSTSPQVMDVWLLDLHTMGWVRLPAMPAYTELKSTGLAWAADGRLVLLGSFADAGRLLVTWRPGEDRLAFRPFARPPADPGPYDPGVLVLP